MMSKDLKITMNMGNFLKKFVFVTFLNFFLKILVPIVTVTRLGRPRLAIDTTNIAWTNVTVTVGICARCSREPTFKV